MLGPLAEHLSLVYLNGKPSKARFRRIPTILIDHFTPWSKQAEDLRAHLLVKALEMGCEAKDLSYEEAYPETIAW